MRKWLVVLLSVLLLCSLVACGGDEGDVSTPVASENGGESSATTSDESPDLTTTTVSGASTTTASRSRTTTTTTEKKGSVAVLKDDKPFTGNAAVLYNKQTSSYDADAEKLRQGILNTKDTVKPSTTGKTYYISPKGDDKNAGTSKDKAWKTTANLLQKSMFKAGDVVLFERGGVYRGAFKMVSGVTYAAYGSGYKPTIYSGERDYADASLWKETSKNIWKLDTGIQPDIGNIIFNHGEACALKMLNNKLSINYQFYHDANKNCLYLYFDKGNPGKVWDAIELATQVTMIHGAAGTHDVTIENLCIKYSGLHGIQVGDGSYNITLRGCEIGYIGGSMSDWGRLGNGFELIHGGHDILVEDCWVYQCYDAGLTHQANAPYAIVQEDIIFRNNLVEYCTYNIEFFNSYKNGHITRDILYEGNALRFAGYGWGIINRIHSSDVASANFNGWNHIEACDNYIIKNNVFDTAYRYLINSGYVDGKNGPTFIGNTYIQHNDTKSAVIKTQDTEKNQTEAETTLWATDQASMEAAVKTFDSNPASVRFETK
jgi:hypothetical protein